MGHPDQGRASGGGEYQSLAERPDEMMKVRSRVAPSDHYCDDFVMQVIREITWWIKEDMFSFLLFCFKVKTSGGRALGLRTQGETSVSGGGMGSSRLGGCSTRWTVGLQRGWRLTFPQEVRGSRYLGCFEKAKPL